MPQQSNNFKEARRLKKVKTGIEGLDDVTNGGLPSGRPTMVCGGPGCGKSVLALEFLVNGARDFDEPGVFLSFEESRKDLLQNFASLNFPVSELISQDKLRIETIDVNPQDLKSRGSFDLEALFIRIESFIAEIGARRLVLDTIESLFSGIKDEGTLRAELQRLFNWIREKQVTTIITAERGNGNLSRHGLEEYVSDCVILLDHRVDQQLSIRRLRIVKYRGSLHGTNEYPFLIDENGISLIAVTSLGLDHKVSRERISTGIRELDEMLGGNGYYRGATVLVSGIAGAGKTSVAAHFVNASFERGERALYFAFEESPDQLMRNMESIGIDLERAVKADLLRIHSARSSAFGLEMHPLEIQRRVEEFKPCNVVFDPITNFASAGTSSDVQTMLIRIIDSLKGHCVTTFLTSLTTGESAEQTTRTDVSAFIDTWILMREIEVSGERNRGLYVMKSRGMAHSNQVREFQITSHGVRLVPVYLGSSGVLTGSARLAQEAREREDAWRQQQAVEQEEIGLDQKNQLLKAKITALEAEVEMNEKAKERLRDQLQERGETRAKDDLAMARSRKVDPPRAGSA